MRFYCQNLHNTTVSLPEDEAQHAARVLRLQPGDEVELVDGLGTLATGRLLEAGKKGCTVAVLEKKQVPQPTPRLHVAIAPTKIIDRYEWFLEKATELGAAEITPLLCRHSERKNIREDRMEGMLVAAMKQCKRLWLPAFHPLTPFEKLIQSIPTDTQKFIAHCADGREALFSNACLPQKDAVVLIGPEGDFSPEEIEMAMNAGFVPISLGEARLRTETAGVFVAAVFMAKNGG